MLPIGTLWAQQDSSQTPARSWSNWRTHTYLVQQDTLEIDSLAIFPSSLKVWSSTGQLLSDSTYQVLGNQLVLPTNWIDSTLRLRYRILPYNLTQKRQHKDAAVIGLALQHDGLVGNGYTYNPFTVGSDAFQFGALDYSGVFARGISLGNNQDLVLNSNFNLQVSGMLGDVEILGAITDNNIPLQPEGNTQQLDEFDRIFIQFKYKRQRLIAGDYDLKRPKKSYFMNYFRRLQGGQLDTDFKIGKGRLKTDVSFAVSKGKFARNQFDGIEGNQGPYRLRGASGEQFIIIIAGTERVFIDGILLERGAENDYIIDYNQGEITFTPNQLITKDKRIQVEFSYTELTFLRTLTTANIAYKTDQTQVRFNFYSEQDAKDQSQSESLTDSAKAVLRRVGDRTDQAFVSSIRIPDLENANVGVIFYELIDTTVNGINYDSVLVFTNSDSAKYTARFSLVTTGGNYRRVPGAANGTVFEWLAPDPITGRPRGTHEPVELLATPKQRQLYNIGLDQKLGKQGLLAADIALSNVDENTFSEVGNDNNQGLAARLSYQHNISLGGKPKRLSQDSSWIDSLGTVEGAELQIKAHYEYLAANFEFIEPYRPREFDRDWNINFQERTQEHLYRLQLRLIDPSWGTVAYQFGGLNKDSLYNGFRHTLNMNLRYKGWRLISNSSLVQSKTSIENSVFIRPRLDLSHTFEQLGNWKVGVYGELEQNRRIQPELDTLQTGSFYYNLFKVYSALPLTKKVELGAYYIRRYDYSVQQQDFAVNTVADDVSVKGEWQQAKGARLRWNLSYRNLAIEDSATTIQQPKETYLGRLEYVWNLRKGFIRSNTIYQLGAGQQQKIEYNYVKVDQGRGTHIWVDRNEDGVQQVNEFEQAAFQDQADYLRVTILTGQFIRTNNVTFSQSLSIRPKVLIQALRRERAKKTKEKRALPWGVALLQRFSSRSIFKIERSTYDQAQGVQVFNPFQLDVADTSLVSVRSSIQNNLYFNRTGVYSLEFTQQDNRGKTLLTTGFESRNFSEYVLRQRLNIKPGKQKAGQQPSLLMRNLRLQAQLTAALGQQSNQSEFFPIRDYQLETYRLEPQITFLYKKVFRVILKYNYKYKANKINEQELLESHDVTAEFNYNQTAKTNIRASFSVVQVAFDGDPTSAVGYTMTEGLQSGTNYLWNLSLSQALSKNIQLTVSYEGRKTGDTSPIIHVGRAEIRANF